MRQQTQGTRLQGQGGLFDGWWIVIIGCIQDPVKGGTLFHRVAAMFVWA
jgi:hypothetical protein